MTTKLDEIAKKARTNPTLRFTSLAHVVSPAFLKETWRTINRRGAAGVDRETVKEFEVNLDARIESRQSENRLTAHPRGRGVHPGMDYCPEPTECDVRRVYDRELRGLRAAGVTGVRIRSIRHP